MHTLYRAGLVCILFPMLVLQSVAQTPPTATEAFNLRIKCRQMSDKKASDFLESNRLLQWELVSAWNTSKYDPTNNRCYGRIYQHITKKFLRLDHEADQLFDLQTDELLADAMRAEDKRNGNIWDPDYKKGWLPTCRADGCPSDFGDQTFRAAQEYMNEFMADPRKQ
jgi:hypothetical protein